MKKIKSILALILVVALFATLFAACSSSEEPENPGNTGDQSQTGGKLTATAAGDQRTQQIQHTTPQPFLHGSGNVRPLGLQNKVFQSVISGKIHGHFLSAALGRSTI